MKKDTKKNIDLKTVKAVNKNVRSSTRKLSPILRSIVGKKADEAIRDLSFSEKRISKALCIFTFSHLNIYRSLCDQSQGSSH